MPKSVITYLFCFDDRRSFSEEVKKRFFDQSRYVVFAFHNIDDFVNQLTKEKDHDFCKVAILGLQDTKENFEVIDHLTL